VLNKKMPPWFADSHYGEFRNAPKLTQTDISTLVAWADSGAREGDPADRPADRQFPDGWRIRPDVVVTTPEPYYIPASGIGEIHEFTIPNPFKEDTWVTAIEVRPSNPSVVHHVIVKVAEPSPGGQVLNFVVDARGNADRVLPPDRVLPQGGGGSYSDVLA